MACDADLTIEGALRDPLIAAVMRADRVDPRALEVLLRGAKRRIDEERLPHVAMAAAARCREAVSRCGRMA